MASHTRKGLEVEATTQEMVVSGVQFEVCRVADRLNDLLRGTRGWLSIFSFSMTLRGDEDVVQAVVRPGIWAEILPETYFFTCDMLVGHRGGWWAKGGSVHYGDLSFDFEVASSASYMKLWPKRNRPTFL